MTHLGVSGFEGITVHKRLSINVYFFSGNCCVGQPPHVSRCFRHVPVNGILVD